MFWKNNNQEQEVIETSNDNSNIQSEVTEKDEYADYKSSMGSSGMKYIDLFKGDLIAYLFIEKEHKGGDYYSLVSPVIKEKLSGQYIQLGITSFALQGGGGKNMTEDLFLKLKKYEDERNAFATIVPMVIDSKFINDFEYMESKLSLDDMIKNAENLLNYHKTERLEMLFKNYVKLRLKVDYPKDN